MATAATCCLLHPPDFVQGNFLAGRTFYDDVDLAEQYRAWLRQVNTERPSDATGVPPAVRLAEEQPHFGPLPAVASDYGFFDCVVVSREGLVAIETNRYSVPAHLMGRALTARIHRSRVELFADQDLVATHVLLPAQNARVIDPAHARSGLCWETGRAGDDVSRLVVQPLTAGDEVCPGAFSQASKGAESADDCAL
jgi:hypothetical protein